ncbi:MAG: hypothetical protein GXP55_15150 [Deltaproteobacteria bacterium]|nr:hypothetical protein [Deltaproteobacteria bacterium]
MKRRVLCLSLFACALVLCVAPPAQAQRRAFAVGLNVGSGLTLGTGGSQDTVMERTPIFLDAVLRSWSDEAPNPVFGAALRLEVDGRVSVGIVPRIEWDQRLGSLELRPFAGVPFIFAPFSLLGLEVGVSAAIPLGDSLNLVASFMADAYVWGSDLPGDSAVVMLNGTIGIEFGVAP